MAILGIGSNIGNKYINILLALELLSEYGTIVNTSHIYITKAMYVTDQNDFLNLVCKIDTNLPPINYLMHVK
jgi:2-amino-4-hydroxy-6-hydroxymethyldihydropteridine diphosphokinase